MNKLVFNYPIMSVYAEVFTVQSNNNIPYSLHFSNPAPYPRNCRIARFVLFYARFVLPFALLSEVISTCNYKPGRKPKILLNKKKSRQIKIQIIMYSTRTIIRRVSLAVVTIVLTMAISKVSNAQRQEGSVLLNSTEFTIKPGHNTKFQEGVKAWKACYIKNEGAWNWDMWSRLQGEGNVYALTSISPNWADFDERDEAGRNCRDIGRELITPHVESTKRFVNYTMPANSNSNPWSAETKVVSVTYWTVNNSVKFMEAVNEVHNVLKEKEGNIRSYWYSSVGGGPDDAHYWMATPYKNFAQMDEVMPGVWTVVESVKGKRHSDKTRDTIRESIDKQWSYIFTLVEDLSHRPGEDTASE
jgi:hypothetical protein